MDIYDEADLRKWISRILRAAIEGGASIQEAADVLCRADGVEEVARKCAELGLKPKANHKFALGAAQAGAGSLTELPRKLLPAAAS